MRCEVCGQEVPTSKTIHGLYYCSICNCYGYIASQKKVLEDVGMPILLKSIMDINPLSDLFTLSTIGLIGDLCNSDQRLLFIANELIVSNFPLKKSILNITTEKDIANITDQICQRFLFDSLSCDYLVRAFAYALGKCKKYKDINAVLDLRRQDGVISLFEVSHKSVRPGDNVVVRWKINSLQPSLHIEMDGNTILESFLGEGSVNCTVISDCVISITALDRRSGAELAVQHLKVEISKVPIINKFYVDSPQIVEGESSLVSWDAQNYEKLTLLPGNIDVTGKTSHRVFPKTSVEYTLIADNVVGERVDAHVVVNVRELPRIGLPSSISINDIESPKFCDINIPSIVCALDDMENNCFFNKPSSRVKRFLSMIMPFPKKVRKLLNNK